MRAALIKKRIRVRCPKYGGCLKLQDLCSDIFVIRSVEDVPTFLLNAHIIGGTQCHSAKLIQTRGTMNPINLQEKESIKNVMELSTTVPLFHNFLQKEKLRDSFFFWGGLSMTRIELRICRMR